MNITQTTNAGQARLVIFVFINRYLNGIAVLSWCGMLSWRARTSGEYLLSIRAK
jgi:hypothetical protein